MKHRRDDGPWSKRNHDSELVMKPQEDDPTSQWTEGVIEIIQKGSPEAAQRALAEFCEGYRPLIYRFFRRQRLTHEEAEDWTQDFFASRILRHMKMRKSFLHKFELKKNVKFRVFLAHILRHFYRDKLRSTSAAKSGAGLTHVPIEDLEAPEIPAEHGPAEDFAREFDRAFALEIIRRATEWSKHSTHLMAHLRGELSQQQAARELGLSESAFREAYHRFRHRLAESLREEIAKVVGPEPKAVDEEVRYLMGVFAGGLDPAYASVTSALSIPSVLDFGRSESSKQSSSATETTPQPALKSSNFVRFSAFLPGRVRPDSTFLIDVWAYLESQRKDVLERAMQRRAAEERAGSSPVAEGGTAGPVKVRRDRPLIFHLVLPGFPTAVAEQKVWWTGDPANSAFVVQAPSRQVERPHLGWVEISRSGIPVARVHFELLVADSDDSLRRESVAEYVRSIFACYASEDRPEVLLWARGAAEAGVDVFVDVLQLREGQNWEQELQRQVPTKDRFCLFWSAPASRSVWVEKEWRCALEKRGIGYIRPVPFADPRDVPPPQELAGSKHFNDLMRIIYDYERSRRAAGNQG